MAYTDVNLPGYNLDAVKKNTGTLTAAGKEVGPEVLSPECRGKP
jgi:hypothetical protein